MVPEAAETFPLAAVDPEDCVLLRESEESGFDARSAGPGVLATMLHGVTEFGTSLYAENESLWIVRMVTEWCYRDTKIWYGGAVDCRYCSESGSGLAARSRSKVAIANLAKPVFQRPEKLVVRIGQQSVLERFLNLVVQSSQQPRKAVKKLCWTL